MTVLGQNFDEPTEMTVFKDGRVMFLQRKGEIMLYEPKTNKIRQINKFNVWTKSEDGMMGLALDPNYEQNKWVYIYYSHPTESVNQLSRFEFHGDSVLTNTEKVMLKVPVQRQECCHTGGSIVFDSKGLLYLSTGDNTNPFASDGYSPSDERPDRAPWDAQGSSANTNDLRGKILRIKPEANGTYSIPDGNLFPKGDALGRPEIYVMGCRNPYRISVDKKTGFVYWGEVGPDAGQDSVGRGPKGHDEVNQAKKAGFFGWPLFVGNNKAYNKYDFAAKKSGDYFNAEKPMNTSPNNTGHKQLPPAQKAFIWYPYGPSPEFPIVNVPSGSGGRNAMAGQVFYTDEYQKTDNTFPDYYNGKLFIYEWMRGWILAVTMDKNGDLQTIEPFMGKTRFNNPMDMQFAADGSLYLIEYGTKWFARNEEARLIRITFNAGNRKPLAKISNNKTVGATPLIVQFSSAGTEDYDGDALKYEWNFDGTGVKSTDANPTFTYEKAGIYNATLTVTDSKGASTTQSVEIKAGNDVPEIEIAMEGNSSFYFDNKPIKYEVKVKDKEDGSMAEGKIKPEEVTVTVNYLQQGYDMTQIAQGHQVSSEVTGFIAGKRLMDESTCKSCHQIDNKSIGPSYKQVAERYKKADAKVISMLATKIIKGGNGVWGEQAMSAHPNFNTEQASEMVKYILSLGEEKKKDIKPSKGELTLTEHVGKGDQGVYFVSAAYTDRGGNGMPPITNQKVMVLKNPMLRAVKADKLNILMKYTVPQIGEIAVVGQGSLLMFKDIDLTGIGKISIYTGSQGAGGFIEVREGSPEGRILGTAEAKGTMMGEASIDLKESDIGKKDLYFIVKEITNGGAQPAFGVRAIEFKAR
jgi:cytochrome c